MYNDYKSCGVSKDALFLIHGQLCTAQQQTNFIYTVAVVSHKKKKKKKHLL